MGHVVRSICIVGGGTAGWLTAGIIAARHRSEDGNGIRIKLIESDTIGTIGVGEGTWPTMRTTLKKMVFRKRISSANAIPHSSKGPSFRAG